MDHSGVSQMLTKTLGVSPMLIAVQKPASRPEPGDMEWLETSLKAELRWLSQSPAACPGTMPSTPACLSAYINTHDTVCKDCIALAFEPSNSTIAH